MRSVAVTGASSGIGRATALLLARREFQVFAGVRKVEDAEALDATRARSDRRGLDHYGERLLEFMRRGHEFEKRGSPPDVVARVVLRALTARRPRARYRVGKGAWPLSVLPRLFPKR